MRPAICRPMPAPEAASFDLARFRSGFPAFADPAAWPDDLLQAQFDAACLHISPRPGKRLAGAGLERVLHLMTAHLLYLLSAQNGAGAAGGVSAMVSGASVDKVSVTLTPPPLKSQWSWWLSLSPHGAALLALLKQKSAGGLYVGGAPPERAGFRKAGGVFTARKETN